MKDRAVEKIDAADEYQQEGPMTTFFRTDGRRGTVDSWSTRVASFRTAEVVIIRRFEGVSAEASAQGDREVRDRSPISTLPRRTA